MDWVFWVEARLGNEELLRVQYKTRGHSAQTARWKGGG